MDRVTWAKPQKRGTTEQLLSDDDDDDHDDNDDNDHENDQDNDGDNDGDDDHDEDRNDGIALWWIFIALRLS